MCHLFDSLVRPVPEYGGEIWGYVRAEEIERVHCNLTLDPYKGKYPEVLVQNYACPS